jgi:hypothetical protein
MSTAESVLRSGVGAVLLFSAGAKLADLGRFGGTISTLIGGVRAARTPSALAKSVVLAEVCVGTLALLAIDTEAVDFACLGLTSGFLLVAIAGAKLRPGLACRCFGTLSDSRFDWVTVTRAALLALAAGITVGLQAREQIAPVSATISQRVLLTVAALVFVAAAAQAASSVAALAERNAETAP